MNDDGTENNNASLKYKRIMEDHLNDMDGYAKYMSVQCMLEVLERIDREMFATSTTIYERRGKEVYFIESNEKIEHLDFCTEKEAQRYMREMMSIHIDDIKWVK